MSDDPRPADWRRRAFPATADPALFWRGGPYDAAFTALRDAVVRGDRLVVVTGETGTGKSLLVNVLAEALTEGGTVVGRLPCALVDGETAFLGACARAYGLVSDVESREALERQLAPAVDRRTRAVLLIDEAQTLPPRCYGEIAWLLEAFEGLTVVLAGDDAVLRTLEGTPEPLRSGAQAAVRLRTLSSDEVGEYIAHALTIAGSSVEAFTPGVIREVCAASGGTPRVVNAICRKALRASLWPDMAAIRGCAEAADGPRAPGPGRVTVAPRVSPARRAPRGLSPPARIAIVSFAAGALVMSVVLVSTSQSALHRGGSRDPELPELRAVLTPVLSDIAARLAPEVTPPALREVAPPAARGVRPPPATPGVQPPLTSAPIASVQAAPPATESAPRAALGAPPPRRSSSRAPRDERGGVTAPLVRGTGPEETDARAGDGGAIIEWLFEEYARDTARRAE